MIIIIETYHEKQPLVWVEENKEQIIEEIKERMVNSGSCLDDDASFCDYLEYNNTNHNEQQIVFYNMEQAKEYLTNEANEENFKKDEQIKIKKLLVDFICIKDFVFGEQETDLENFFNESLAGELEHIEVNKYEYEQSNLETAIDNFIESEYLGCGVFDSE